MLIQRYDKSVNQGHRQKQLVEIAPEAACIYNSGMVPRSEYCVHITGWSKSQMDRLVTMAVKAHKKAGTRACTASVLRWRGTRNSDPRVRLPLHQVWLWAEIWWDITNKPGPFVEQEEETRMAWREIVEEAEAKPNEQIKVLGTITPLTC